MGGEADQEAQKLFGARLSALRKGLGISQEDLATASEVGRSYLSGVERGKRNISLANICRLAKTLGVRPGVLLDFELP